MEQKGVKYLLISVTTTYAIFSIESKHESVITNVLTVIRRLFYVIVVERAVTFLVAELFDPNFILGEYRPLIVSAGRRFVYPQVSQCPASIVSTDT